MFTVNGRMTNVFTVNGRMTNVFTVNGRMTNDFSSNHTFNNISVIDYCLCCPLLCKHINHLIVHDGNPLFSDGHSVLLHDTVLIAGIGTQCHISPGVKTTVVSWEHSKITQFQCALSSNTGGFEKVSTLLNNVLTNISEATTESVNEFVANFNDLLLKGAEDCNNKTIMLKIKRYGKQNTTETRKYDC